MNLWTVRRTGGGWGEPELLPAPFNSTAEDIHAAATDDAIWLASNREGGRGRSDLFRVTWDGTVSHAGDVVNDELSQPDVWVSEDETVMVLAITDSPDGLGGDDLYISWNDGSGSSAPVNLGPGSTRRSTSTVRRCPWTASTCSSRATGRGPPTCTAFLSMRCWA